MFTLQTETVVRRPVSEVFAYVADQRNTPQWQSGLHEVQRLTPGPLRVGTEHIFVRRMLGRRYQSRTRYIAYDPDRRVAFQVDDGVVTGRVEYRFCPLPSDETTGTEGTQVSCFMQFALRGFARFAEPLLRRQIQRESRRDDARLAQALEASG